MIPTSKGHMSPASIVDELTYSNYVFNRDRSPHISAERWARIYPRAVELEARYLTEKAVAKAKAEDNTNG